MDALTNIRVIDLTTGVAGPIVGMFLADFGADVVKIESLEGDPSRSTPGFAMWNRGKRGVVIDPADPGRLAWLREHIQGADVLLTNGEPQLDQFHLETHELLSECPRLVIVELPPYLRGHTPWFGGAESAELLGAIGGISRRQASVSGRPVDLVNPTILYVHGLWGAVCTVAALIERQKSGAGQLVEVSGINALTLLAMPFLVIDPDSDDPNTATGAGGRHPTYTRVQAGDGGWLAVGGLGGKFERAVLDALGLGDLLSEERMGGSTQGLLLPQNFEWVQAKIAEAFMAKSQSEWLKIFDDLGVPCGPVNDRDEWLDQPQVEAIGMRVEVDDPEHGQVVMPGIPLNLTLTPGRIRGPAPTLGQHNELVEPWAQLAYAGGELPPIRPGPLAGVTVLNSGPFVATPYAGSLLSELGARVIKVEAVAPDSFRQFAYGYNGGMESFAIDLKRPEGREAFHGLVKKADAFIDGLRPGVTEQLKIDFDTLSALNPGLVTLSLSGYGEVGELQGRPGVDMVLQGESGMMKAQGGSDDPVVTSIAICDIATAAMSALGVCLALHHRNETGQGQRAWDSLAGTATYLQAGDLVRFEGRPPAREGGEDYLGDGPYDRLYQVADGWIRISETRAVDSAAAMSVVLGLSSAELEDPAKAIPRIEERLVRRTANDVVGALNKAGLPAVPARKISQVIRDPRLLEREMVQLYPTDDGGFISGTGNCATFGRSARRGSKFTPGVGEHTRGVLRTAGFDDEQIDGLVEQGVAVEGHPIRLVSLPPVYR